LEAADERWAQRPVDEARGERFFLARASFALEKAARDLAGGKCLLLIVDGQREKIHSRLNCLCCDNRAQNLGPAIADHDGAVRLAGNLAGFHNERPAAPHHFFAMYFKHFLSFQRRNGPMPLCKSGTLCSGLFLLLYL